MLEMLGSNLILCEKIARKDCAKKLQKKGWRFRQVINHVIKHYPVVNQTPIWGQPLKVSRSVN
jgi:hypothetical protein